MELWTWQCGARRVLMLNTRGTLPEEQERGLFLCRSLTLPAERLLMGPVSWSPHPGMIRLDHEGVRIPAEKEDVAAFLAFLAAAGYGSCSSATDGLRVFTPDREEIARWQGKRQPDAQIQRQLLSLG